MDQKVCKCYRPVITCKPGQIKRYGCCQEFCVDPSSLMLQDLREVKGSYFDLGDVNVHDGAGTIFAPTGNDYVKAGRVNAKAGGSVVFMGI
mmetsp:Transcript_19438/g.33069  ORF Transcript_19438/g.33069 Transcript_19438/m.33069 type:complete len:91 (-) Transcript_19438:82-354(-)